MTSATFVSPQTDAVLAVSKSAPLVTAATSAPAKDARPVDVSSAAVPAEMDAIPPAAKTAFVAPLIDVRSPPSMTSGELAVCM